MQRTGIEWTHWSANPLKLELPDGTRGNACIKCSTGCANCYAEAITRRWWPKSKGKFPGFSLPLIKSGKVVLVEEELQKVLRLSRRIAAGKADPKINRVFLCDMTDMFGAWVPDEMVDRIFAVCALTPNLIHQILTKRPERMAAYLRTDVFRPSLLGAIGVLFHQIHGRLMLMEDAKAIAIPLRNVHLGTSVENQAAADHRVPQLLKCPAAVRFLSMEPLIGPVRLPDYFCKSCGRVGADNPLLACGGCGGEMLDSNDIASHLHWVILGGESGGGARPTNIDWHREVIAHCNAAGIFVFEKQLGARPFCSAEGKGWPHEPGDVTKPQLTGDGMGRYYAHLVDPKGGDLREWPADLRVREFPEAEVRP